MNAKNTVRLGIAFAIMSAITFGVSGSFAKALLEAGWTPTAAVTARLAGGALVVVLVATIVNRGWLSEAIAHGKTLIVYGVIPVAGVQLCFYNAVSHLSVGVALLLEYLSPVLVVGWVWASTRKRPKTSTLVGAALALAGASIVLNVFSGAKIEIVGVAWALGATVCGACYFLLSHRVSAGGEGLDPLTLAAGGLIVGAITVALLGVCGVFPMTFTTNDTVVAGHTTSFLVPVVALGLVATAMAYLFGINGVARLGPSHASLMGLGEVLCAVTWAWLLVGEEITWAQAVGGGVVLLGLALASRSADRTTAQATWPEVGVVDGLVVEPG